MLATGQMVGDYLVEAALGEDPLASTWKMRGPDDQPYVLRLLQVRLPVFQERFRRAAEALRGVAHPNLVSVSGIITHDALPAVITEYVPGGDLAAWIGGRPRSAGEVLPVFHGLVRGARAAHAAGLIHRNLKPTKVLMTEAGVPKINDFALGKVDVADGNQALTQLGTTFGTPHYMSPEQFRGAANVDQRSDIFSLGCLLYEMLAGERAFQETDLMKIYQTVVDGEVAPLPYDVPPTLLGLVLDLLDPIPEARPQTADAILIRLQEDSELAALLPEGALSPIGPSPARTSFSPHLKSKMAAEEEAEAAARRAAVERAEAALERARRKHAKQQAKEGATALEAAAPPLPVEVIRPISRDSSIASTPAPIDMRKVEEARSEHSEPVHADMPTEGERIRWQLAVLLVVILGLIVAVGLLIVAILKGSSFA